MTLACRALRTALVLMALPAFTQCTRSTQNTSTPSSPVAADTAAPGHDWTTFDWDVGRSGASTAPTGITAQNVGSMSLQQVQLGGTVDASAIYLSDVQVNGASHAAFFVTTTYGKTIAVNANTGAILWTYTPPNYASWVGSARITNATPVADPDSQFIYAASPDGNVQKLNVSNGQAVWSTAITTGPQSEKIASPLSYFAGHIIATTDGYVGDAPPYQGHIAILDAGNGQVLHVWNSLCSNQAALLTLTQCGQTKSGIWGRAGVVIDSTTGDIYVATGNGLWDGATNWGDAVVWLDSSATHMLGNYTPTTTLSLNQTDTDLGSTSPVLLGGGYVAQGGKDGSIRVLSLTAIAGTAPHMGGEAQVVATPSGAKLFTAPAVLQTSTGTTLFAADGGATAAWTVSGGQLSPLWKNSNAGTSPVVAGGLLYVYDPGGALRVYQASSGALVATLSCGSGHWNSPIVADGRIALPEGNANNHQTTGVLDIWRAN
jgi:outer membrane protein assembly factor BamB